MWWWKRATRGSGTRERKKEEEKKKREERVDPREYNTRLSVVSINLGKGKFANYNKILASTPPGIPASGFRDRFSRFGRGIATKLNSNVTRLIHVFGKQDPAAGVHCRPVANRRKAGKPRETMLELRRIRGARASLIPEFINYTVHAEDIYYVGYKLQLRLPYKRNGGRATSLPLPPSIHLSLSLSAGREKVHRTGADGNKEGRLIIRGGLVTFK